MAMASERVRILITGGSGFLGQAIIKIIQKQHPLWDIYVLDRCAPNLVDSNHFLQCDVTDETSVVEQISRVAPDVIVHTAAMIPKGPERYDVSHKARARIARVNIEGTRNIVRAAEQSGCRALVYTSSCAVIADDLYHDYPLMTESLPTGRAFLTYGWSKTIAENLVLEADCKELATCSLRPFTIIGAGEKKGAISALHDCIARNETAFRVGDGHNLWDVVCIDNAADAHVLAAQNLLSATKTAAGQAIFISNGEPIYFRDFMLATWANFGHVPRFEVPIPRWIATGLGFVCECITKLTSVEMSFSRGAVLDAVGIRYADISKARSILGYEPKVSLETGLRQACQYYQTVLDERMAGRKSSGKLIDSVH